MTFDLRKKLDGSVQIYEKPLQLETLEALIMEAVDQKDLVTLKQTEFDLDSVDQLLLQNRSSLINNQSGSAKKQHQNLLGMTKHDSSDSFSDSEDSNTKRQD